MKNDDLDSRISEGASALEPFALKLLRANEDHISIDQVAELARRELKYSVINNTDKPLIARELIARHPGLKGRMKTRTLGKRKRTFTLAEIRRAMDLGFSKGFSAGYDAGLKAGKE